MKDEKLGNLIKSIRKKNKMTLKQISEKTGLSISFLSQVERSKSLVTLASLKKISEALGVSPSCFFEANFFDPSSSIIRNQDQEASKDLKFCLKNLTGNIQNPIFEPILATLYPGEENRKPYIHNGQEFIYILEGMLTVILNNKKFELHPGDSMHINSSEPHTWFNETNNIVKLLLITAPPKPGGMD